VGTDLAQFLLQPAQELVLFLALCIHEIVIGQLGIFLLTLALQYVPLALE